MSDPKLQSASASLNLFCDLDRDGDPDLVVGNAGTPEPFRDIGSGPFVSVNDGFGNFRMLDQAVIPEEYTWHLSYACADLNQDGWQDLLISNEETGDARQLQLLYNEGGMSFSRGDPICVASGRGRAAALQKAASHGSQWRRIPRDHSGGNSFPATDHPLEHRR